MSTHSVRRIMSNSKSPQLAACLPPQCDHAAAPLRSSRRYTHDAGCHTNSPRPFNPTSVQPPLPLYKRPFIQSRSLPQRLLQTSPTSPTLLTNPPTSRPSLAASTPRCSPRLRDLATSFRKLGERGESSLLGRNQDENALNYYDYLFNVYETAGLFPSPVPGAFPSAVVEEPEDYFSLPVHPDPQRPAILSSHWSESTTGSCDDDSDFDATTTPSDTGPLWNPALAITSPEIEDGSDAERHAKADAGTTMTVDARTLRLDLDRNAPRPKLRNVLDKCQSLPIRPHVHTGWSLEHLLDTKRNGLVLCDFSRNVEKQG